MKLNDGKDSSGFFKINDLDSVTDELQRSFRRKWKFRRDDSCIFDR